MRTAAFTGHRPKDLPAGFGYRQVAEALDRHLLARNEPFTDFVTGGALGIDTWAAEYAIQRRIPLHLVLPFAPEVMTNFWPDLAKRTLEAHIERAVTLRVLAQQYDVRQYQQRNIAMVNMADDVLAFWSGKPFGGTANCIRYALGAGKPVFNLLPGPRYGRL